MRFIAKAADDIKKDLLELLVAKTGASATKARSLIKKGAVLVDDKAVLRPDAPVSPGQVVEITGKKDRKPLGKGREHKGTEKGPLLKVLYEDDHIIAAQKPAGMLSISTRTENTNTFYRAVSDHIKENSEGRGKIFIVHRLDREVSGVMLFAKSQEVKRALQDSWEKAEKVYSAVVHGRPPRNEGTITGWLCETGENLVRSCPAPPAAQKNASRGHDRPAAKKAVTHYRLVAENREQNLSLLEVRLETGRKHQIRVHLRDIGCPVVGDKKYGVLPPKAARGLNKKGQMGLHAARLSFNHPVTGRRMVIESPAPKSFLVLFPFKAPKKVI